MKVYGSRISYYTGKLEAYLRYKNIAYTALPTPYDKAEMLKEKVGAVQMPIVDDDGKWMSDTTPIIMHLETIHPDNPVLPQDPVVGFMAHLIEDYGDEWLWRSAMYYRWWYDYDRQLASNVLTDELTGHVKMPRWMRQRMIIRRQVRHYVKRDGVTDTTRQHIEQSYHNALAGMTAMLENRPFLLGNAPSLADYGMMGPMFRHYGQDPTPQEIMRNTAPAVFEWVARMWHAKNTHKPEFVTQVPDDAEPLLKEICETHLVQLAANAAAFAEDTERFDMTVQGCDYRDIAVSQYRVWCLEELRRRFNLLSPAQQDSVKNLLPHGQADILWNADVPAQSGFNSDNHLPFGKAINVFEGGLP
ncbi:Glutathione S-transferase [Parasphingorhabdus marina DSM 22363]|uniref:Glutathione S-transferase n=1 Tax=Parasphingorhabdus marina DSM 22363 TaxID=1123272 RepID=A0A1N6DBB7_9SPHN|nr:glutathione S-transferase family protein [Parasphingorhabdus marina]SIN68102.1 Glutathione S-transferase [Parasphingorhabdus marina DSM 22363]